MKRFLFYFCLALVMVRAFPAHGQSHDRDPFSLDYDDHVQKVVPGQVFPFAVQFKVPEGNYLYDDKTSVFFTKTEDLSVLKTERPSPEPHQDNFLKKVTQVFFHDFKVTVYFQVPKNAAMGRKTLEAMVRYQGCGGDFCYRPVEKTILLPVEVQRSEGELLSKGDSPEGPPMELPTGPEKKRGFWEILRESNPERLLNLGRGQLLGWSFLGGIATSLTPCVLPIIPLTLAFIGVRHRRRGNILRALCLVLGMVAMYSSLGFLAASLGLKLGFLFQSRFFVLATAIFFLIFALGLFEIIPFHLPSGLHNRLVRMGGEGPFGAFLAGMTIGLIASPCVGPLIAPLLLIAAQKQDRLYGFFLLLSYGLGMGVLFMILGSSFAELASKIRGGRWTHFFKRALGLLMIAPALFYGYSFASTLTDTHKNILWVYQFSEGLKKAQELHKPILVDFYANWCPPCKELDRNTFSTAEFKKKAEDFVLIKVDCSSDDANCKAATDRYNVVGWPTVLFLKSDGEAIPDVKLVGGFADTPQMLELMQRALSLSK